MFEEPSLRRQRKLRPKMCFHQDGRDLQAEMKLGPEYQGWSGAVHGGALMTFFDVAMAYAAHLRGLTCATAQIQIRFTRFAPTGKPLVISAAVIKESSRLVETMAAIRLGDGAVTTESTATFFVLHSQDEAAERQRAKAVIWELDNVLADTWPHHLPAWRYASLKAGKKFGTADLRRHWGEAPRAVARQILGADNTAGRINKLVACREDYLQTKLDAIAPVPQAVTLLRQAREAGFRNALISSLSRQNTEGLLKRMGIESYFQTVSTAENIPADGDYPGLYLRTARKLAAKPEDCVAIVSSPRGAAASRQIPLYCIALPGVFPRSKLQDSDLTVDSLAQVSPVMLHNISHVYIPAPP
jgi:beta-phosphoglucomutase